jgi:hypothetical protein
VAIVDSVKPATNEYDFKFDIKQVTFTDDVQQAIDAKVNNTY